MKSTKLFLALFGSFMLMSCNRYEGHWTWSGSSEAGELYYDGKIDLQLYSNGTGYMSIKGSEDADYSFTWETNRDTVKMDGMLFKDHYQSCEASRSKLSFISHKDDNGSTILKAEHPYSLISYCQNIELVKE